MSDASDPDPLSPLNDDQLDVEVGLARVTEVFTRALLDAAEAAGRLDEVIAELDGVVSQTLAPHAKAAAILASPDVSDEEKAVLRGRLDRLRALHQRIHAEYDRMRGRIPVRLITAKPTSSEIVERLAAELRQSLGSDVVFHQVTDPNVIGGAVLQVGDTVYDASIAFQLRAMQQRIRDRIAHEIQDRRDRFRDPSGN